jgi:hypothetical protein
LNGKVRERLSELVRTHGKNILDQPDKVEALLEASFEKCETETTAVATALREGLLNELLRSEDSSEQIAAITDFSQRLRDNCGIDEEVATWAAESIALAIGKLVPDGNDPSEIKTANRDELVYVKGASVGLNETFARVTDRDYLEPSSAGDAVGFRICRTASEQSILL